MVFPSIPLYLDPPTNWHQQQPSQQHHHHHQAINGNESSSELLPQLPPLQAQGPQMGSVRPGPTGDRGQIAKISSGGGGEGALKCPRCESSNTKFCYFNNYSLSQPRHFCKTCRRYWTRGGALRNVPVGGGCRRSKKTKRSSSQSKSPAPPAATAANTEKQSSSVPSSGFNNNRGFMASLENMSLYGGGGVEQWRLHQHQQQFPNLLSGFDPITSSSSFPLVQSSVIEGGLFGESRVKMESGNGGLLSSNLSRISPLMSFTENYSWTDLAASSSSAAHHLF
ncbi:hypothetical protein PIB30_023038 [Stylosanthes scabra]|uniref:Dof zinc finger protein n=1 Tax=Stylosanthes scabra TaxID=79078 RepID=A0ABU6WAA9_9FABA|nr:hypothetical protein [Stylosanthes scabra]